MWSYMVQIMDPALTDECEMLIDNYQKYVSGCSNCMLLGQNLPEHCRFERRPRQKAVISINEVPDCSVINLSWNGLKWTPQ